MNPRVAHIITDLDLGGAERMLVKLLGAAAGRQEHMVLCLSGRGELTAEIERLGIAVVSLGMTRGRPRVGAVLDGMRAVRAFHPTVLQSWMYHADLYATVLWPLVRSPALAWNLRCADMELDGYPPLTRRIRALLARLSRLPAVVVCNSAASQSAHTGYGYRPRRWAVIGNGFDTELFRPLPAAQGRLRAHLGLGPESKLVGMVARVDLAKDYATLLAAAAIVAAARDDVFFVLVGSGVPGLAPAVAAQGLTHRVRLEDARADVAELMAGLDLCVLSSAFGESFPNVLGEAMACGIPCVSTAVGDAEALLAGSGLVVPRRDPRSLAAALIEALSWPAAEYTRRSAVARARIARDYALPAIARRYAALYQELSDRCVA